jgi:hypothetical protein
MLLLSFINLYQNNMQDQDDKYGGLSFFEREMLREDAKKMANIIQTARDLKDYSPEISALLEKLVRIEVELAHRDFHGPNDPSPHSAAIEIIIKEIDQANRNFKIQQVIQTPAKLGFRIENGKIIVYIFDSGKEYYADGTQLDHQLFFCRQSKWTAIIAELEKLINKPNLKEQELQDFFEEYPELLLDADYEKLIPQASVIADDREWRADFVLVPVDQLTFSKVLELKLPNEKLSLKIKHGHNYYSAALHSAISQLKDYHEAFNHPHTKDLFQQKYQAPMFKPDLQLFIGRRNDISQPRDFLEFQNRMNVRIKDWDSVVDSLRRKFK